MFLTLKRGLSSKKCEKVILHGKFNLKLSFKMMFDNIYIFLDCCPKITFEKYHFSIIRLYTMLNYSAKDALYMKKKMFFF